MAIDMSQSGEISGSLSSRLKAKKGGRETNEQDEPKDYMKNWKKRQADQKASLPYSKRQRFEIPREDANAPVTGSFGLGISGYANEAKKAANNIGAKSSKHITFDDNTSTPISKPDLSRRKSVTFTPDTKVEDGFSASKIGKLYLPPRSSDDNLQTVEETAPQQSEPTAPTKPQIPEKKKRKQKKNSKQRQQPTSSTASPTVGSSATISTPTQSKNKENPPYLQYLQQYRDDRSSWKFNSTKQKLLLKNALNIFRIPRSYDSALLEYIAGLQSKSFRTELAKQADEGLQSFYTAHRGPDAPDLPSMDSLAARRSAYQACIERTQDEHTQRGGVKSETEDKELAQVRIEYEKAQRADAVLYEALMAVVHPELLTATQPSSIPSSVDSRPSNDESSSVPTKRKRKARTEVSSSEDSSSSSSSDSSSEDESESEDDSDSSTPPKKSKKSKPIISAELLDRVFGKKDGGVQPIASADEADNDDSASEDEESTESSDGSDSEVDDE